MPDKTSKLGEHRNDRPKPNGYAPFNYTQTDQLAPNDKYPAATPTPDDAFQALFKRNQWVCWRFLERPGKKPAKVPVNPRTGTFASPTNSKTWGSYESTLAAKEEHGCDGIGFVLTAQDPYTVIDLDGCIDPETGELAEWAVEIVEEFDSYTEFSPSRTGLHIWVLGTLPEDGRRIGPVEAYSAKRYVTFTGQRLGGSGD